MDNIIESILLKIDKHLNDDWVISREYDVIAINIPEFYCIVKYEFDFVKEQGCYTIFINETTQIEIGYHSEQNAYFKMKTMFDSIMYQKLDINKALIFLGYTTPF